MTVSRRTRKAAEILRWSRASARGIINSCENKEFEQAGFPLGNDKNGNAIRKHLEGEFHSWDIATHEGVSEIQVFRNFQTALKTGGFVID
jgi:hypothetical protein